MGEKECGQEWSCVNGKNSVPEETRARTCIHVMLNIVT